MTTTRTTTKTAVAVYQDGYAIFGVGKTERSAKQDARKWVDDLSGLDVVACTIGVYNGIKNDTIDSQGRGYTAVHNTRGNTLLVTDDEAAEYNKFEDLGDTVVLGVR